MTVSDFTDYGVVNTALKVVCKAGKAVNLNEVSYADIGVFISTTVYFRSDDAKI